MLLSLCITLRALAGATILKLSQKTEDFRNLKVYLSNYRSPNYDERPINGKIDMLILHYTGMETAQAALELVCDRSSKVSAHYFIDEVGQCYQLVSEANRAWHAGVASWQGESNINARSIVIELVNPGHEYGYRPFTEEQMACVANLALDLVQRFDIPGSRVLAHADVAPTRRSDPGELFDWYRLARVGVGLWPTSRNEELWGGDIVELQNKLLKIGYEVGRQGQFDKETRAAVVAFQRHYVQTRADGEVDMRTMERIDAILHSIS